MTKHLSPNYGDAVNIVNALHGRGHINGNIPDLKSFEIVSHHLDKILRKSKTSLDEETLKLEHKKIALKNAHAAQIKEASRFNRKKWELERLDRLQDDRLFKDAARQILSSDEFLALLEMAKELKTERLETAEQTD
jgi:hypothetical protein